MGKPPKNHRKAWTQTELSRLKVEIGQNTPTRVLGIKHGRTPGAVQAKANALGWSTKPTNQSPRLPKNKRR